ncbi:Ldh family oxidoreductase [Jiella avicenniae]|uniref:Ldh family oxidoreductase n=1 Tax=Jiella avicenniae TaxID=2907202 RepID=A0A9X1T5R5_9HYPH|nr:Ldh family oxidoreductase [Jiella avicenniae]MCE7029472.1 Ldh family oxidoreductase [Jiella avicenniae]
MSQQAERYVSVVTGELEEFCAAIFRAVDVPEQDAELAARSLVEADLRGVGSHGVVRLQVYTDRLAARATNPRAEPRILHSTRTCAVMDGDNGLGSIVGVRAMQEALRMAGGEDCAFVAVRNGNHFGTAAFFSEIAAEAGAIGFTFTIGGINHMTPWGGAEAMLGNNPFAVAFPTPLGFPIVLDMACSVAARGKIIVAAKDGTPIPDDWAVGPDGKPTTDPVRALQGFVQPIAGPKGYALTMTVGLLSTMLSGGAFGSEVTHMYEDLSQPQNIGQLFGVLPVGAFLDRADYDAHIKKAAEDVKSVRRAPGVEEIFLPGEREHRAKLRQRAEGVAITAAVLAELKELGERYGLSAPRPIGSRAT